MGIILLCRDESGRGGLKLLCARTEGARGMDRSRRGLLGLTGKIELCSFARLEFRDEPLTVPLL